MQADFAGQADDNTEASRDGNGGTAGIPAGAVPDTREALSRAPADSLFNAVRDLNAGFGEFVTLLLRDPQLKHLSLADLEWLVVPPLAVNQVLTLRGKVKGTDGVESGHTVALAGALWAKVSKEVDEKLEAQKAAGAPLRLAPHDWVSGDIPWLVLVTGPDALKSRLVEKMRTDLGASMKGVQVRSDGVSVVEGRQSYAEAAKTATEGKT